MKSIEEMSLKELYEEKRKLLMSVVGNTYNTERVKEINSLIFKLEKENKDKKIKM